MMIMNTAGMKPTPSMYRLEIDGRQVAKASATYTQEELKKLEKQNNEKNRREVGR